MRQHWDNPMWYTVQPVALLAYFSLVTAQPTVHCVDPLPSGSAALVWNSSDNPGGQ